MIETIAKICHEANRAWCESNGDFSQKSWENAPLWQRKAAIDGVKLRLENTGVPASMAHRDWVTQKLANGWKYGPVKDELQKTHPCLLPYDELPGFEKKKDILFLAIVNALK